MAVDVKGATISAIYAVVSIVIMLFNKAVLSSWKFNYPLTLSVCQSAVTLVLLVGLNRSGVIKLRPFSVDVAKDVFPMSFLFIAYVIISLSALSSVNLPMFAALRRTTVMFVMIFEYYLLAKSPSRNVMGATGIMVAGALVAAMNDLTFDAWSYTLVILTNLSNSMYAVFIARVRKQTGLDVFGLLYYNTVITLPPLVVVMVVSGEINSVLSFPHLGELSFQVCFISSAVMAFVLNYTTFLNTTYNSPMTQTVVGQIKNFLAFLISLLMFDDYKYDLLNMVGLWIGFSGGVAYAAAKYYESSATGNPVAANV